MSKIETREEFYKELEEVTKKSYDKDFYDWLGHSVEYMYDISVFIAANDEFIASPDDKEGRIRHLLTLGDGISRYYWQRRETDERDPDLWQPAGYHGSSHTCIIQGQTEDECKTCKKIDLHNKNL